MVTSLLNKLLNKRTNVLRCSNSLHFSCCVLKVAPFFTNWSRGISSQAKDRSLIVSYLVNSWGLSLETAKVVSKKARYYTKEKADAVHALLRRFGFTDCQISGLVRLVPQLLSSNAETTLQPKLEFISSKAVPDYDLCKIVARNPRLLKSSLEDNIIPRYEILKCVLGDDRKVAAALGSMHRGRFGSAGNVLSNVMLLKQHGVPQSKIYFLVSSIPGTAFCEPSEFEKIVKEVERLGFEPSKSSFVSAIQVIHSMKKSSVEYKFEVYSRRWGLSRGEIVSAFRKHPNFLCLSEKIVMEKMDFLVKEMGCSTESIASFPYLLASSLDKRIAPRCRVIRTLQSKGLLKGSSFLSLLAYSEPSFVKNVIDKYRESVPQLVDLYKGKADLQDVVS